MSRRKSTTDISSPLRASPAAAFSTTFNAYLPPMWPCRQPIPNVDRAMARELRDRVNALPHSAPLNAMAALRASPPLTRYVEGFCVRHDEHLSVKPHAWLDTSAAGGEWGADGDLPPMIVDPTPGYCETGAPDVVYFAVEDWTRSDIHHVFEACKRRSADCAFPLLDHDLDALRKNINWHWARIEAQLHAAAVYEERTGEAYFPPDFDFRRLLP